MHITINDDGIYSLTQCELAQKASRDERGGNFEVGTIEQTQTVRLVVIGVVFFLAAAVLFDLIAIAGVTGTFFQQDPGARIFFPVLDALNVVAIYGAWRRKSWGSVVAIVLALVILVPTIQAVFFLSGALVEPAEVVFTIIIIVLRLMIVFFAIAALVLRWRPSN